LACVHYKHIYRSLFSQNHVLILFLSCPSFRNKVSKCSWSSPW